MACTVKPMHLCSPSRKLGTEPQHMATVEPTPYLKAVYSLHAHIGAAKNLGRGICCLKGVMAAGHISVPGSAAIFPLCCFLAQFWSTHSVNAQGTVCHG